jgi:HlyD family secretion protein
VKTKWKVLIGVLIVAGLGIGIYASTVLSKKGVVTVQTGSVVRQDLTSLVTASGEIKPRNYINIGANAQGELKEILVKEGDRVRKGQLLARIESAQPEADVKAQEAAVNSAEADSAASEAGMKSAEENIRTLQAGVDKDRSDLDRAKADYDRSQSLYNEHLLAKQDFEMRKFAYEAQQATIRQSEMRLVQARAQKEQAAAQLSSAQKRIAQARANLLRFNDLLNKRSVVSPLDGVVTNLPVRVGETVVPGVQNSAASTIMTIADMSIITSEVKVDETDIVNVKMAQVADVTIDAIPNKTFKGHVIEIGNTAILRSTGVAASQSAVSSQEAKDFKVVIALDDPPDEVRPGLSSTAKITTATRKNVLTIPIQALTVRQKGQLEPKPKDGKGVEAASTKPDPVAEKAKKEELQGVFVVSGGKAVFKKVDTGITGSTDIEVLNGLNEGEAIITGTYQVIRTIANETQVKVDNKTPAPAASKS